MSDSNETPSGALADTIHELTLGAFKVRLLLTEASPEEWTSVANRLETLRAVMSTFPAKATPRRVVGFVARRGRK